MAAFEHTAGDIGVDKGIKTGVDARHYSISAPLGSEISNLGQDLVVSFTVRHDQNLDCGGAYIKLISKDAGFDAKTFDGDDKYAIMFGPDICGTSTRKTHVIFTYKGKNLLTKKNVRMESDHASHLYTLIVRKDNTYEVQIDGSKAESGSLFDDWDFLLPKTIKDPAAKKPSDWVDNAKMDDPEDKKPAGYDDIPAKIPDANAKKPEDWDEEEDGEWTAPQIDNPEYKGVWKAKQIDNPAYKGAWVHPEIPNPDFVDDATVHAVCAPCSHVGFELWQVKAGTIFDDIIIADSVADVDAWNAKHFEAKKEGEKKNLDAKAEKDKKEAEAKAAEAEAARKAAEEAKKSEEKEDDDEEL
jgi:calreticulin